MGDRPGALARIGTTPSVRSSRLTSPGAAEVWVKLEAANPTGSLLTVQCDSGMKYPKGDLYA